MKFHTVLNITITSIPSCYDIGYVEDTRHLITIEVFMMVVSFQVHIPTDVFVKELKFFTTPVIE